MTQLNNVLDVNELSEMLAQGFVRKNMHPDGELAILNYTEKAAYESHWNPTTLRCRGLIYDTVTNEVVARAFDKFFNYGQPGCPEIDMSAVVTVSDKMDGSLGILYRGRDGKYYIATRGSFTSDQAIKATEILHTKYADFKPNARWTYLFEIIYPENRIVCDYAGMNDLVFLGAVHANGYTYDADIAKYLNWHGPSAEVFPYQTMREALAAEPRAGKEGFVVHFLKTDVRVKIKQQDYIELHRIVTNLNARSVWQAMVDDRIDELIEQVPDEFHDFVRGVQKDIEADVFFKVNEAEKLYDLALVQLGTDNPTRAEFANLVKTNPHAWALFKIWDGITREDLYKMFLVKSKPTHDYSPVKVSNDAD